MRGIPAKIIYGQMPAERLEMSKGYWIARVDVTNEEGYKPYAAANPAIFKKFGGRFLIRAGKFEAPEAPAGRATS